MEQFCERVALNYTLTFENIVYRNKDKRNKINPQVWIQIESLQKVVYRV